jgi:hypothetical protein
LASCGSTAPPDHVESNAAWDALGFEVVEHLRVRPIR